MKELSKKAAALEVGRMLFGAALVGLVIFIGFLLG